MLFFPFMISLTAFKAFSHVWPVLSGQDGGHDFFSFVYDLFFVNRNPQAATWLMTAGIALLILTPFIRAVVSVFYFGWEKNFKYVVITLFVLCALAVSLSLH